MTMPDLQAVMDRYPVITGVHPVVGMFPLMSAEEYDGLVSSVREMGLLEPILVTEDGLLLDGRHRLFACLDAEVDPEWRVYQGDDPADHAFAANAKRRNLTVGQIAAATVEFRTYRQTEESARERQRIAGREHGRGQEKLVVSSPQANATEGKRAIAAAKYLWETVNAKGDYEQRRTPPTRDTVAASVGIGGQAIQRAKFVQEAAPDLFDRMKTGKSSVNDAYKEAKSREAARAPVEPTKAGPEMIQLRRHTGETVEYPQPKGLPTFNQTNDQVSWARWTWNPITGCLHGCKFCYARELANLPSFRAAYPIGFEPLFHHERLDAPKNTKVPASNDARDGRVFVGSMADMFGEWVPQDWIDSIYEAMLAAPDWRYLTLTKFPQRYRRANVPPHLWAGASIDRQNRVKATEKAMKDLPVAVRWLSLEPILEPLEFTDLSIFDWIVVGSQTATNQPDGPVPAFAPPIEWIIDLVTEARKAGCAIYLKPNLLGHVNDQSPGMRLIQEIPQERAQ